MIWCLKLCFRNEKKKMGLNEKSLDLCSDTGSCGQCLGEDRISSLPNDILWLIMSFLTSKEVLKASLLSRRWLDLWVHTPLLNLHMLDSDDSRRISRKDCQNYVKWVNCVLRRHKGHYLEEFKIGYDLDDIHNRKHIHKWLIFALERKVQRLELNLHGSMCHHRHNYVFPRLVSLNYGVPLPQFDLKCLKSLSLDRVDVTNEAINFILQDCPFVERLEVVDTFKLVELVISNPTLVLKYLQMKNCNNLKVVSISKFNLVSLKIPSVDDLNLTDLPMLVEVSLSESSSMLSACLSRASSRLPQLQALTFESCYDVTRLSNLGPMANLKRLVIGIVLKYDQTLTKLISVIDSCPRLEEFVLKAWWVHPERSDRTICDVKRPSSLESKHCLKVFEFLGYYGRVSDVELVMHVLEEYGCSLEKIIIDPRDVHCFSFLPSRLEKEQEARRFALQQFEDLRESIPQHVHLHIR